MSWSKRCMRNYRHQGKRRMYSFTFTYTFTCLEEQIITNYVKILCDCYVNERFRKYDKHWENKENSEVLWERSKYCLSATAGY